MQTKTKFLVYESQHGKLELFSVKMTMFKEDEVQHKYFPKSFFSLFV